MTLHRLAKWPTKSVRVAAVCRTENERVEVVRSLTADDLYKFKPQLARWSFRRKLRNPFAGLVFFERVNDGSLNIVSRHWPHLLCWSWLLNWDGRRPWRWIPGCHFRTAQWARFFFTWQHYDYMVGLGPVRVDAVQDVARQIGVECST